MLYTYVIFGAIIFYMLAIASVFVLRARQPDLPRPYRTLGYPLTPLLYVAAVLLLLGNMLADDTDPRPLPGGAGDHRGSACPPTGSSGGRPRSPPLSGADSSG